MVVGVEPSVRECDDFYCALAETTGKKKISRCLSVNAKIYVSLVGGQYIPLVNAARLLSGIVQRVTREDMTLRQAFMCVDKKDAERDALVRYSQIQS